MLGVCSAGQRLQGADVNIGREVLWLLVAVIAAIALPLTWVGLLYANSTGWAGLGPLHVLAFLVSYAAIWIFRRIRARAT